MSERKPKYPDAPDPSFTGWPVGIKYIIGNEGCERFSFYGMKSILKVYLIALFVADGMREQLAKTESNAITHFWIMGVYALPMIGAVISDRLLGKYSTIVWLSLGYCAGHACLAIFEGNLVGIYTGLTLIAVGAGGIKPCVSAHVGDQFGKGNWDKLQRIYQAFYFIINFGSFFAYLLMPIIKERWGWSVAFAIPGILMGMATIVFWMGRNVFVHVPARPGGRLGLLDAVSSGLMLMTLGSFMLTTGQPWSVKLLVAAACLAAGAILFSIRQRIEPDNGFLAVLVYTVKAWLTKREDAPLVQAATEKVRAVGADVASPLRDHWFFGPAVRRFGAEAAEGPSAVLKIISVFLLVSVFWSLFDQHATTWVDQAELMDRQFTLPIIGSFTFMREQIPFVNPALVMLMVPLVTFVIYPGVSKLGYEMTPLRRMTVGMITAAGSFVAAALIQERLEAHEIVHVSWQLVSYALLTIAEVMVSVTGLEFAYSQSPRRMKSTIMSFWMATVALGNAIAAFAFESEAMRHLKLSTFFWIFAAMMAGAGVLFGLRAAFYRYKDYSQA